MGNRRRASKLQKTVMLYRKPDYVRSRFNIFLPDGESGICPPFKSGARPFQQKKMESRQASG